MRPSSATRGSWRTFLVVASLLGSITALPAGAVGSTTGPGVDLSSSERAAPVPGPGGFGTLALPGGTCDGGAVHDDGVAENAYSGNPATVTQFDAVQLYTPSSYPAVFDTLCLALTTLSGPDHAFTITFWDDDGASGTPGTFLGQSEVLTVDDLPTNLPCNWYEADLGGASPVITEGSVFIGVQWNPSTHPSRFMCSDESGSTPLQVGFVEFNLGSGWQATQTVFPGYKSLMLRPVESRAWFEPDPGFRFDDVPMGHLFDYEIHWLRANDITRGCNPPTNSIYCPDSTVTRGQMAAFLVRALNLPGASDQGFTDIGASVFVDDINALAAADITRGCNPPENDLFCPNANVTREQMAAFLYRALDLPAALHQGFIDIGASIFVDEINALAAADITRGCNPPTNNLFCPTSSVTRDQMAAFLYRGLTGD